MKIELKHHKKEFNSFDLTFKNLTQGQIESMLNALREYSFKSPVAADVFLFLSRKVEPDTLDAMRSGVYYKKNAKPELTNAQVNFFDVELRNEREGGVSPSDLNSAIESLEQAPEDIVIGWCDDEAVHDDQTVHDFFDSLKSLRKTYGGDTLLKDLLPREK